MVNKKHGKQNRKSVDFSLRTIKICRFEIDGVKYVYCIKHAYKFLMREQVAKGLRPFFDACVNVFLVKLNCKHRETLPVKIRSY